MAMIGKRDKPTYYSIVGEQSRTIVATAPASRVMQVCKKLQAQYGEKLLIELIEQPEGA
jgi:hypothetical protein